MLERIQRDLFALGARLADPPHRIAGTRRRRPRSAPPTSRGSRAGSTRSRRRCRRCAGSSSPAARRPARRCTSRARSAAAPSARWSALGATTPSSRSCSIYLNRLSDLLFVMARAREPPRRRARNRVVNARSSQAPTPTASGWRDRTTRTFPSPRACCRRAMRPHIAAIYAFARLADDLADEGDRPDRRAARDSRRLGRAARPRPSAPVAGGPHAARSSSRCGTRSRRAGCRVQLFDDLLSAFRQDVTVKRYETLGRSAGLLPAIGEPGRTAGAARRGLRRRRGSTRVRRRLHGAAADELLAGSASATGRSGRVYVPVDDLAGRRRRRERSRRRDA